MAPQRTHLGTGSKLRPNIHHQLFEGLDDTHVDIDKTEGLDDSHVDIVKTEDSKISELQAKVDHDLN